MSNYNPYTKRQTMIEPDYEVYRYRSTYMNEVELHHHDFYEIYLLLRGRVEYIVENQLYRVRPGDWMLCSPLELHQARIATDADAYERIVLWIARPFLENLSTPRTSLTRCFDTTVPGHTNLLRLPGATGAPLRTTVDRLCALKANKDYGSDLLAQSALVELLVGLNRAAADRAAANRAASPAACLPHRGNEAFQRHLPPLPQSVLHRPRPQQQLRQPRVQLRSVCPPANPAAVPLRRPTPHPRTQIPLTFPVSYPQLHTAHILASISLPPSMDEGK